MSRSNRAAGMDRRDFLVVAGAAGYTCLTGRRADAAQRPLNVEDAHGVLIDVNQCIGCRKCEWACNDANRLPVQPLATFEDKSVYQVQRRPDAGHYTVVNQYAGPPASGRPSWMKFQCMHCNDPACDSACIVSAFTKHASGPVTYDPWRCMGCRYCMVACPFQVPAYEYDHARAPRIQKCNFCFDRISKAGGVPACVEICPPQCITFGKRKDLLALARHKIKTHPDQYVDHIYGEYEAGGTSWLYVAGRPFEEIGLPKLSAAAPPRLTEEIQAGIFKNFIPQIAGVAVLGMISRFFARPPDPGGEKEAVMDELHVRAEKAAPITQPFWTPGVWILGILSLIGLGVALARFVFGLESVTHLTDQYPWGIWIGIDVATGVALAAGGFTTAALAHLFHREKYSAVTRPALLTAMLGYTFVTLGLLVDLGRYYNIWHPLLPSMWSGHSVLFEVGMCVTLYLHVLYIEFLPIVIERFRGRVCLPGFAARWNGKLEALLDYADRGLHRVITGLIIAGVLLSFLHQSSLGTLMLIAPSKMHPLWYTPVLPLFFLLSAIAVGFPMVIFESLIVSRALGRRPEMPVLTPLSRFIPIFLAVYLTAKILDLAIRDQWGLLGSGSTQSIFWLTEVGLGVAVPLGMLLFEKIRRTPSYLFTASLLVVLGVALNRINVFLVAYTPVYKTQTYFPSWGEIAITVGLISALLLAYRLLVTVFPVLPQMETEEAGESR